MPRGRSRAELTGRKFWYLTVESLSHVAHGTIWNCRCVCGKVVKLRACALLGNNNKSCGCQTSRLQAEGQVAHGEAGGLSPETREYRIWQGMKDRCYSPNNMSYKNYGGRGITVCDRWKKDFAEFLKDMGRAPTAKHSIDRFPNMNGNYEPGNVRWASPKQQGNNTRRNLVVVYRGKAMTAAQLADSVGMQYNALYYRLRRFNMDAEKAVQPSNRALVSNLEMTQLPLVAGVPSAAQSFKST